MYPLRRLVGGVSYHLMIFLWKHPGEEGRKEGMSFSFYMIEDLVDLFWLWSVWFYHLLSPILDYPPERKVLLRFMLVGINHCALVYIYSPGKKMAVGSSAKLVVCDL